MTEHADEARATDLPLFDIIELGNQYHRLLDQADHDHAAFVDQLTKCSVFSADEAVIAMAVADAAEELAEHGIEDTPAAMEYLEVDPDETYPPDHWIWRLWRMVARAQRPAQ